MCNICGKQQPFTVLSMSTVSKQRPVQKMIIGPRFLTSSISVPKNPFTITGNQWKKIIDWLYYFDVAANIRLASHVRQMSTFAKIDLFIIVWEGKFGIKHTKMKYSTNSTLTAQ